MIEDNKKQEKNQAKTVVFVILAIAGMILLGCIFFGVGVAVLISRMDTLSENWEMDFNLEDLESLPSSGSLPSMETITAEQIECAIGAIGQERANEILSGAQPTFSDILKISPCLK